MTGIPDIPWLLSLLGWLFAAWAACFVMGAFGLTLVAAKLRERHGWLAWIPLANLYLMCRLAGSSLAMMLLALIPVVNLVAFAVLGSGMAKRLGLSPVLGVLFAIPVFGNIVPLSLGISGETEASRDGRGGSDPWRTAALHSGAMLGVAVLCGGGYLLAMRMTSADAPPSVEQVAAKLPERLSGTLAVFPIDTDPADPAAPGNVASVEFPEAGGEAPGGSGGLDAGRLPPWIAPQAVSQMATTAVAADYRPKQGSSSARVVSLALREQPGSALPVPTAAELETFAPHAQVSGAEVVSATGEVYRGYQVKTDEAIYFALENLERTHALLISGNDAASVPLAERLTRNIGNGQGLLDYSDYRAVFDHLPATPPGASLEHMQTFTSADIANAMAMMNEAAAEPGAEPQIRSMLALARTVAPQTAQMAMYRAGGESGYFAATASYGSGTGAWTAMQALRSVAAMVPEAQFSISSIPLGGEDAWLVTSAAAAAEGIEMNGLLLRQGSSLVLLGGAGVSRQAVLGWAEGYAAAR